MSGCSHESTREENALPPCFFCDGSERCVLGLGVLILNKIHTIRHAHTLSYKKRSCLFKKSTRTLAYVTQATCCTFSMQTCVHITEDDVLQALRGLPSRTDLHGMNNDLPWLLRVSENIFTSIFTTQSPDDSPFIRIFHPVYIVDEGDPWLCPVWII